MSACQSCGGAVSLEAGQASRRLRTLPQPCQDALKQIFTCGELPESLCATCMLAAYSHALEFAR